MELRPGDILDLTVEQVDIKKLLIQYCSPKVDRWYYRPKHPKVKTILRQRIKALKSGKPFDYAEIKNMGQAFNRYPEDIGLGG